MNSFGGRRFDIVVRCNEQFSSLRKSSEVAERSEARLNSDNLSTMKTVYVLASVYQFLKCHVVAKS